ncbi:MAG: FAD-binding oxidoreductase [Corynebacterium sp.]|uniref:FAD-binding oxidoreductase n=1 Tax=Corynebacterium sp. TaxID=1720 RepID=UPI0026DFDA8F|nr:FAD-binding oxidoreductase [Corynebacterium sp.]MDO5670059.1 FAD-binding oxidoreductase [Corynebacterium sp.]
MQTLTETGTALRERSTEFRDAVQQRLYQDVLESRQVFPISLLHTHLELAAACAWVLERTPATGEVPQEVLDRLQGLGRDHRRHGFPAEIYPAFAVALSHGLHSLDFPQADAAAQVLETVCTVMAAAAQDADHQGLAPAFSAEVLEVQRRTRHLSVVRLEAGVPIPYRAGQHLPVTTSYLPGVWRMFSPALPSNEFGQVEFHIRMLEGSDISQLMATPKPGDYWLFGQPRGTLQLTGERDVLMIAHGTGLAPLRAMLYDMLTWEHRPRVHLFFAAEYPGELYDLMGLWNLAIFSHWLSVVPVVQHEKDPWWVGATEHSRAPFGLHQQETASVCQLVSSYGAWADRDVLVVGNAQQVENSVRTLVAGGTPPELIQTEVWARADQWPSQDGQ